MSTAKRAAAVGAAFVAVVVAIVFIALYLVSYPPTVAAAAASGGEQNITLQTVGSIGFGVHPTWVSYLALENGKWVHTTLLKVKANTLLHFTIYQYDSGSQLRNPFMDQVQGTEGGVEILNGASVHIVNDNTDGGIGHTFAIPTLGISVPMPGISSTSNNACGVAPCATTFDHNTVQFTIKTPAAGIYPWQCFVPCGLGFPIGNGGPMSTLGYMGGFLKVVA